MSDFQTPNTDLAQRDREFDLKNKEAELKLKERELELDKREIELERKELQLDLRQRDQVRWRSPLFLASMALLGTALSAVFGYWTSLSARAFPSAVCPHCGSDQDT